MKHLKILLPIFLLISGISFSNFNQEKKLIQQKKKEKKAQVDRKFKLTTDEGTWISVDVSPDGKTIAFDLLGDIYTLPIEGGKAKRITSGLTFDTHMFSPDGKELLVVSDRSGGKFT